MPQEEFDAIVEDFEFLDEWEDRYRYVIELGRAMPPLAESARTDAHKVTGCASQVWLDLRAEPEGAEGTIIRFEGDSDAQIVRGLIAILRALYSGARAEWILQNDAATALSRLDLESHLSGQRSNGLKAMIERIREFSSSKTTS